MDTDRLLTEIERQKKYLARLPKDFDFPLFNARQALESQRRNGYRNTAAAAREIVDNAIEAGGRNIHVVFDQGSDEKYGRSETVTAVAFIDDGPGMLPEMARYALSWGGGTHFDDPSFIGRFGFGLPNSSINQTRKVEVYTKTASAKKIMKATLDVGAAPAYGTHSVPPPVEDRLPQFVEDYLEQDAREFNHGTVVVWWYPDHLSYKSSGRLKEHLLDDFGVTYRHLLNGIDLNVQGVKIEPVDPLFLDPKARYYLKEEDGGAIPRLDRTIPVKYFLDAKSGTPKLVKLEDAKDINKDDQDVLAVGSIHIRIARFPIGFVEFPKRGQRVETEAHRRAEIRKTRAGMSFVRAGREIDTVTAFPKSARDRSSGLGTWPLLQGYAYHLGIEVAFKPELDEVFGITNDKQSVRPIEDFWKLLASEDIDRFVREEYRWQPKERDRVRREKIKLERSPDATPGEAAAATADAIQGTSLRIPEFEKPTLREQFEAEVKRRVGLTEESLADAIAALEREAKRRPYLIDFYDDPAGPFFRPEWTPAGQVLVKVNRRHPFYEAIYLEAVQHNPKVKHAVDVVLLTLGKAELTIENEVTRTWYEAQRETVWSPFLKTSLKTLRQSLSEEHQLDEEEDPEAEEQSTASG